MSLRENFPILSVASLLLTVMCTSLYPTQLDEALQVFLPENSGLSKIQDDTSSNDQAVIQNLEAISAYLTAP